MAEPDDVEFDRFRLFCHFHFKYFGQVTDWLTHDEWLEGTHYNEARKQQLRSAGVEYDGISHKNKSFIKDEAYDSRKFPRGINSYDDATKYALGPFIKSLEHHFFESKFFVKGRTNTERDKVLRETFGDQPVLFTDFSHFESHHIGKYADLFADFILYLSGNDPNRKEYRWARQLITGSNVSVFSNVKVRCHTRLMSGALWTSFQNTFLNFFVMAYLNHRSNANRLRLGLNELKVFCEGDDGIMQFFHYDRDVIKRLGLDLKIGHARDFTEASFCGRVISSTTCFTDPVKVIDKLSWFPTRYAGVKWSTELSLIKARAMSVLENHRNCPILDPLARRIISMTRNIDHQKGINLLKEYREETLDAKLLTSQSMEESVITLEDRVHLERLFGIVVEQQEVFEEYLRTWRLGQPLLLPWDHKEEYVELEANSIFIPLTPPTSRPGSTMPAHHKLCPVGSAEVAFTHT